MSSLLLRPLGLSDLLISTVSISVCPSFFAFSVSCAAGSASHLLPRFYGYRKFTVEPRPQHGRSWQESK